MKTLLVGIIAVALAGCTTPAELTQARVVIRDGKKSITLESHKDTSIKGFERMPDGTIKLESYASEANRTAIEAAVMQSQMVNNLMMQNAEMLRQFGGLAAQYFSAGAVRPQPQVITNIVVVGPAK